MVCGAVSIPLLTLALMLPVVPGLRRNAQPELADPATQEEPAAVAVFVQVANPEIWPHMKPCLINVLNGVAMLSARVPFPEERSPQLPRAQWPRLSRDVDFYIGLLKENPDLRAEFASLVEPWNTDQHKARVFVNDALENKGADIGEFMQQILQVREPLRYGPLLKVHSKSDHGWRCQMLTSLCGSPEQVAAILTEFDKKPRVGLLGPWSLVWKWDTPVDQTFRGLGEFGFRLLDVEASMRETWEFMFNGSQFPLREQYRIAAGSMYWARSAPLLQNAKFMEAASRLLPVWTEGYHTSCQERVCKDAFALERLIPTMFYFWYGLSVSEAPLHVVDPETREAKACV